MDDPRLPGWDVQVEEISAGAYRLRATSPDGRTVEATGADPDRLIAEAAKEAGPPS